MSQQQQQQQFTQPYSSQARRRTLKFPPQTSTTITSPDRRHLDPKGAIYHRPAPYFRQRNSVACDATPNEIITHIFTKSGAKAKAVAASRQGLPSKRFLPQDQPQALIQKEPTAFLKQAKLLSQSLRSSKDDERVTSPLQRVSLPTGSLRVGLSLGKRPDPARQSVLYKVSRGAHEPVQDGAGQQTHSHSHAMLRHVKTGSHSISKARLRRRHNQVTSPSPGNHHMNGSRNEEMTHMDSLAEIQKMAHSRSKRTGTSMVSSSKNKSTSLHTSHVPSSIYQTATTQNLSFPKQPGTKRNGNQLKVRVSRFLQSPQGFNAGKQLQNPKTRQAVKLDDNSDSLPMPNDYQLIKRNKLDSAMSSYEIALSSEARKEGKEALVGFLQNIIGGSSSVSESDPSTLASKALSFIKLQNTAVPKNDINAPVIRQVPTNVYRGIIQTMKRKRLRHVNAARLSGQTQPAFRGDPFDDEFEREEAHQAEMKQQTQATGVDINGKALNPQAYASIGFQSQAGSQGIVASELITMRQNYEPKLSEVTRLSQQYSQEPSKVPYSRGSASLADLEERFQQECEDLLGSIQSNWKPIREAEGSQQSLGESARDSSRNLFGNALEIIQSQTSSRTGTSKPRARVTSQPDNGVSPQVTMESFLDANKNYLRQHAGSLRFGSSPPLQDGLIPGTGPSGFSASANVRNSMLVKGISKSPMLQGKPTVANLAPHHVLSSGQLEGNFKAYSDAYSSKSAAKYAGKALNQPQIVAQPIFNIQVTTKQREPIQTLDMHVPSGVAVTSFDVQQSLKSERSMHGAAKFKQIIPVLKANNQTHALASVQKSSRVASQNCDF